jgi:hypothetical protein
MPESRSDRVLRSLDPASPSAYLQEAAEALTACGSAPALYGRFRGLPPQARAEAERFATTQEGPKMQARFARTSILFSALAAEAYVNDFLDARLTGSDSDAIDRLPTVEKYVIGIKYAEDSNVFKRGAEPVQTLTRLFAARNALVHPKPGGRARSLVDQSGAAEFLAAAGTAGYTLVRRSKRVDLIAELINRNAGSFIAWGKQWTGALPAFDAPEPIDLLHEGAADILAEALAGQLEAAEPDD